MLTEAQRRLLLFIDKYIKDKGISPSFSDILKGLNLSSKANIHRLLLALEERGFIRRLPNRVRAIEILRLPTKRIEPMAIKEMRQADEKEIGELVAKIGHALHDAPMEVVIPALAETLAFAIGRMGSEALKDNINGVVQALVMNATASAMWHEDAPERLH